MERRKSIIITVEPELIGLKEFSPTIWLSADFSEAWFTDALHEARTGNDENSTRREIVFSSCFLESYIFEWVRRIDIGAVADYFHSHERFKHDPRYRRKLLSKWKEIPKELYEDKRIPSKPELNFAGLGMLVQYRNGLVHVGASRPSSDSQTPGREPVPPIGKLKKLGAGWALLIAIDLVKKLHHDLGTDYPNYLDTYQKIRANGPKRT